MNYVTLFSIKHEKRCVLYTFYEPFLNKDSTFIISFDFKSWCETYLFLGGLISFAFAYNKTQLLNMNFKGCAIKNLIDFLIIQ